MISYRFAVERTRRVRDLLFRKKFVAVKESPGGRQTRLGAAETRNRARRIAQNAARPNGSPTAGGAYTPGYEPGSEGSGGIGSGGTLEQNIRER